MRFTKQKTGLLVLIPAVLLTAGIYFWQSGDDSGDLPIGPEKSYAKRLTTAQYENIIRDIFGPAIDIGGRLPDPIEREEGLVAVGASRAGISVVGFEIAEDIARHIASQVVNKTNRQQLIGCGPASPTKFDSECARQFITTYGRFLFRRPLTDAEFQTQLQWAQQTAGEKQDFYLGLERSLVNLLISPHFLFRMELLQLNDDGTPAPHLTPWARASRLSFLLWNSSPDAMLLDAAEHGELRNQKGLQKQVDRMLKSVKVEYGVRGFFEDMLEFEDFERLSKDGVIYPKYTYAVSQDVPEQLMRTILDHILVRESDYRDLFTTPHTFLTPSLAAMLGVPLLQPGRTGEPDQWVAYEYPPGDIRAGIVSQPAFVALHSHPGRTSPTLRGKALRENLLCQTVPDPPPNVDFSLIQQSSHTGKTTMRQRLDAHVSVPACAGCHKITDPIGLALESFDGSGQFRTTEQGLAIDTSGELDGVVYDDASGLGQALRDNPNIVSCVVNRVYSYGIGRQTLPAERRWLKDLKKEFAQQGYRFIDLLRIVATSEEFYRS